MPTEAADLVAAGAGEEVYVVNLQWLHAQRALHGVVLYLGAVGHPMARRGGAVVTAGHGLGGRSVVRDERIES